MVNHSPYIFDTIHLENQRFLSLIFLMEYDIYSWVRSEINLSHRVQLISSVFMLNVASNLVHSLLHKIGNFRLSRLSWRFANYNKQLRVFMPKCMVKTRKYLYHILPKANLQLLIKMHFGHVGLKGPSSYHLHEFRIVMSPQTINTKLLVQIFPQSQDNSCVIIV